MIISQSEDKNKREKTLNKKKEERINHEISSHDYFNILSFQRKRNRKIICILVIIVHILFSRNQIQCPLLNRFWNIFSLLLAIIPRNSRIKRARLHSCISGSHLNIKSNRLELWHKYFGILHEYLMVFRVQPLFLTLHTKWLKSAILTHISVFFFCAYFKKLCSNIDQYTTNSLYVEALKLYLTCINKLCNICKEKKLLQCLRS